MSTCVKRYEGVFDASLMPLARHLASRQNGECRQNYLSFTKRHATTTNNKYGGEDSFRETIFCLKWCACDPSDPLNGSVNMRHLVQNFEFLNKEAPHFFKTHRLSKLDETLSKRVRHAFSRPRE
ncbi:hypothetical protein CEXT_231771 [Caerostris extrusa]|uniref:Uncharacterized protein n=1 Tax=Caerostris extrusa TaxID=172846 RepID=A0AAV4SCD4_CAEEX|nr:hypothetical protein CEXT_231771 [Caerostris extrusa]